MKLSDSKVELARRNNKVVYQDGNRVVKVFNDNKPAADIFNEAHNTASIMGTDIKVSDVIEVSRIEGGEWDGSWAIANHYIASWTCSSRCTILRRPSSTARRTSWAAWSRP